MASRNGSNNGQSSQDKTAPAAWHGLAIDAVCDQLECDRTGLSHDAVIARQSQYGPNSLPTAKPKSALVRFARQFNNLLIYVLLIASSVTAMMAHWIDTVVILAVCFLNATIGFIQEGKAEETLRAIKNMLSPSASVLRDGQRKTIPTTELVPGDVVRLEAGDRIPADIRLFMVKNFGVLESALTGESLVVTKNADPVAREAALGDRKSMAYAGTLVTTGQAQGLVVATGFQTEIGKINRLLGDVAALTTPLLRQMSQFAKILTGIILLVAVMVFAFGVVVQGMSIDATFVAVVSLTVAGIPEGLPAILTIAMAIGVQRMAGQHAIIRRLPAVETLGAVSVICSDKTGTLTRNEMTVQSVWMPDCNVNVSGIGYDPHGGFVASGVEQDADDIPGLALLTRAAMLCNDAKLVRKDDAWNVLGDPMEGALLVLAMKAGFDHDRLDETVPRLDVLPFDSSYKYMATLHHDHAGHKLIVVKGAPDRLVAMASHQRNSDGQDHEIDREKWTAGIAGLAAQGMRVLAVAIREMPASHQELTFDDVENGLVMIGLLGLVDPPRPEAISAVANCRQAGIRVKMITGDHGITAQAIGAQLGLENTERYLTGPEIDAMNQADLQQAMETTDIFARTSPENKLQLVMALQAAGRVVAMTGDGVNDAPALKRSDVGIAMGISGTEAAKEAAEMVLVDDNFASIVNAVREGRTVYDNLKKSITFLLPINGGETLGVLVALMMGVVLPISPLQILWVNMVSSIGLALSLAFEKAEPDLMARKPRNVAEPVLSGFLVWRIVFVSLLFMAGIFGSFELALMQGVSVETARTVAVNVLVAMEVFYLFSVRYLGGTSLTLRGMVGTRPVLIAISSVFVLQLIFTYVPVMHFLFETRPVSIVAGIGIIAAGIGLFVILELEKLVIRVVTDRIAKT
ncbi:cation-transporting P-type ATPase [Thalassospira povalilytica]|uniref:cation-transporting P-type ATPase n=1 Tax=Thalassospira povalilytica TaxID=732237 RepID=UPI003AA7CF0E